MNARLAPTAPARRGRAALLYTAANALGDDFDIRDFHYTVLRNGEIPLTFFDDQIAEFVRSEVAGGARDPR
jgi:hypothetical protein